MIKGADSDVSLSTFPETGPGSTDNTCILKEKVEIIPGVDFDLYPNVRRILSSNTIHP
jgi:hypothetical protein